MKSWKEVRHSVQRQWKKIPPRTQRRLPALALYTTGLLFLSLSCGHWYARWQALRLDPSVRALYTQEQETRLPAPTHIEIPWRVDVAIESQIYTTDGQWTIANNAASYWMHSARPGEAGNIVIYGHNTSDILGNIRAPYENAPLTLTTEDGFTHTYKVTEWHEVSPQDTHWLEPTNEEVVTIYTCSGFMDSKRFVVRAVPMNL